MMRITVNVRVYRPLVGDCVPWAGGLPFRIGISPELGVEGCAAPPGVGKAGVIGSGLGWPGPLSTAGKLGVLGCGAVP
jgi:hypothetical protein